MKTLNTLIAAAALSIAVTGVASADSVADTQVRAALSEQAIQGQAQPVSTQQIVVESGKSIAANRVEQSLHADMVKGERHQRVSHAQSFANDAGKSVSATRVQHALETSV
ncbi:hypothetical protein [Cobetia sp. L2A1]|uniref:hypothetical protein n=1 Tax=Cobetia sp. L2A1 TaxID=2686360 RepID=UPI00131E0ECC|nr:hypothetical protein [Cobetia sp. L2A1]